MVARGARVFGRAKESASCQAVLDGVADHLEVLVLEGEPGIGKTTLLRGLLSHAADRGYTILSCRPVEAESKMPFVGLDDLLSPVLGGILPALPASQARALDLALLRREAEESPLSQRMVAAACLSVMSALARPGPMLVAVDDLEWLDAPTSHVLNFSLRRLADDRVIVLVTRRTEGPLLGLNQAVSPEHLHRIPVGPLALPDLDRLLVDQLNCRFQRADLLQIGGISAGNPFFAVELGRVLALHSDERAPGQFPPIPQSLRQLVVDRIAALPQRASETLLLVASLAQPTVQLIEAGSRFPHAVRGDLAEAEAAGVLEVNEGRVRFTHPLLASVVYADAAPEELRRLHRHLADIVTEPEERARHLAYSATGEDRLVAFALEEAAHRARARGAPETAAAMAEQACRFTPQNRPADLRSRALEAAELHFVAGNTERSRILTERLVATAAPGSQTAEAFARLGGIRLQQESIQASVEAFERALAEPHDAIPLSAECELGLGVALFLATKFRAAAAHFRASLEIMQSLGGHRYLGTALSFVGFTSFLLGEGVRADLMNRALALGEAESAHPLVSGHPKTIWGSILKWTGDLDDARDLLEQMHNRALLRGEVESLPVILYHLAELETWAGRWEQAGAYAGEAYVAADQSAQEPGRAVAIYARALVDAHLGHIESGRVLAQEGLAIAIRSSAAVRVLQNLAVLGFIEFSLGNMADARHYFDPAMKGTLEAGVAEPGVLRFLPEGVEVLIRLGDLQAAAEHLEPFDRAAHALDRPWALAAAARCRVLLAAAVGDLPGALEQVNAALGHHKRVHQPFELARTLLVVGEVQRRTRRRGAARATFASALQIFEDLGAAVWAEHSRSELRRIGGPAAAPNQLTPTEHRVAALVAEGSSNRETAEALFISVRTVEDNLSKIYRKLHVRSRTQLARALRLSDASEQE
jgi:DNA-binding CsgD family transcriptional regulator